MKIEILEKDKERIKFILDGANPAFANALRRIMISELPAMAIEDIAFFENSSAAYDEMIAHRLGMVPLTTDPKSYNLREDCTCKKGGCSKCQCTFTLSKKGPCTVYSGDLKSSDKDCVPADANIPIIKLGENQKLKLEATAVLGIGKEHAKFQPGVVSYEYFSEKKGDDIKYHEGKFVFTVESNGAMKAEQLVLESAKILAAKAKEFEKLVK